MSRVTGFTDEQKVGILQREGGLCALSGALVGTVRLPRHQAQTANHRLNRGIGGDPTRNGTDNGCAICSDCNELIENDDEYASAARRRGIKLREGDVPRLVAFWCVFYRQWVQLIGDAMFLTGAADENTPPTLTDLETLDVAL